MVAKMFVGSAQAPAALNVVVLTGKVPAELPLLHARWCSTDSSTSSHSMHRESHVPHCCVAASNVALSEGAEGASEGTSMAPALLTPK